MERGKLMDSFYTDLRLIPRYPSRRHQLDEKVNPYDSASSLEEAQRVAPKQRVPLVAWALVPAPPLATLVAVGIGAFVDSLRLGPAGFLFVIVLVGIGAIAIGVATASVVASYLARGSIAGYLTLLVCEIIAVVFVYGMVRPLLGGWS